MTAEEQGVLAAEALRQNADTSLIVAYMVNSDPRFQEGRGDPVPYLQRLAPPVNGEDRHIIINDASQLANRIKPFDPPAPKKVENKGITGVLSANGFSPKKVGITAEVDKNDPTRIRYKSEKVILFGAPGQPVENILTVTAKSAVEGGAKRDIQSITRINYTQRTSLSLK